MKAADNTVTVVWAWLRKALDKYSWDLEGVAREVGAGLLLSRYCIHASKIHKKAESAVTNEWDLVSRDARER
jgi:hypothetical protein